MRFAVQVRSNHTTKPGGDTALAKAFTKRIILLGHQAVLVSAPDNLVSERFDWFIAFNLDQPLELFSLAREAKLRGTKVAVYALHHPSEGVRAYLSNALSGIRGAVARLVGGDPERYFYTMAIARGLLRSDLLAIYYALRPRKRLLCDTAKLIDQVLVSGPSEAAAIQQDLPMFCRANFHQVPHPIDFGGVIADFQVARPATKRRFLIAGRIESRKNPCVVLDVAGSFPDDEFIFAGLANRSDKNYVRVFQDKLSNQSNCFWVGQLDLHGLLREIANADAVISPSWFEVMSLINLFAYALGTRVISSAYTYDGDVLGDFSYQFFPNRPDDLVRTLRNIAVITKPGFEAEERMLRAEQIVSASWCGFDEWLGHLCALRGQSK